METLQVGQVVVLRKMLGGYSSGTRALLYNTRDHYLWPYVIRIVDDGHTMYARRDEIEPAP